MQKIFTVIGILATISFIVFLGVTTFVNKDFSTLVFDRNAQTINSNATTSIVTDTSTTSLSSPIITEDVVVITSSPISVKQDRGVTPQRTPTRAVKKTIENPGALIITKPVPTTATSTSTTTAIATTQTPISSTTTPSSVGQLNPRDIMLLTNSERTTEGFSTLIFSSQLTMMAEEKTRDMIKNNYFAHVSPTGVDISMLAKQYGYAYLNIGENLALGDFVSSQEVVTGWMNSPGHRANILNKSYTEIGVAAIIGTYNGRTVWFAVQEFGRPMSDCQIPDLVLKEKIASDQSHIKALEISLTSLKSEIDAPGISAETYNVKVNEYNAIVGLFNDLVTANKKDVSAYNSLTDTYNVCIIAP